MSQTISAAKTSWVCPTSVKVPIKSCFLDLKAQSLCLKFSEGNQEVTEYQVSLLVLALGPVHHSIELEQLNAGAFNKDTISLFALLSADIQFTQIARAEIQLVELQSKFTTHLLEEYSYYYKFSVITFDEVYESHLSQSKELTH